MYSWNYRVVSLPYSDKKTHLEIRGVYYQDGKVQLISDIPASVYGETPRDLKGELELFKEALQRPVIDYDTLKEI